MTEDGKMLAAEIVEFGKPYRLGSRDIPQCPDNALLIQVWAAGFCHSDLQVQQGQFAAPLPMIPSHEPAGKIVEVGSRVKGTWKVGHRVGVLNFKNACANCVGCRQILRKTTHTDPRFCENREMAGFKHDGAFAQYMIADPDTTILLPDGVSFEQGAPLMCAGATAWGALQKVKIDLTPGDTVGVVGIGGVGQLAAQFAKAMGYKTVAMDNRAEGRQLASEVPKHLQPDLVVDTGAVDAEDRIFEFTSGEGLAAIIVCTDSIQANTWSLRLLRVRGVMVPLGLPKERWQFDTDPIVFRELVIRGNYVSSRDEAASMMKLVEEKGIQSDIKLVPYDQIPNIMDIYLDRSMKGRLVVQIPQKERN